MDPNACFDRIMDAIDEHDADEFHWAMRDLWQWLDNGGFPPLVQDLRDNGPSVTDHDSRLQIRAADRRGSPDLGYEMVKWTPRGELQKRHALACQ